MTYLHATPVHRFYSLKQSTSVLPLPRMSLLKAVPSSAPCEYHPPPTTTLSEDTAESVNCNVCRVPMTVGNIRTSLRWYRIVDGSVEHFILDRVGLPDDGIISPLLRDAGSRAADKLRSMAAMAGEFPYRESRGNMRVYGDYGRF